MPSSTYSASPSLSRVRYLRHIGYYRLSPYTIPFQNGLPDQRLRDGIAFDDVLDLYVFVRAFLSMNPQA